MPPVIRAELIAHYREHRLREAHMNHVVNEVIEQEGDKNSGTKKPAYNPYARFGL